MTLRRKIKYFFIRKGAKSLIHAIIWSCKIKINGEDSIGKLRKKNKPIIYITWHKHIFFNIYKFKNSGVRPLISLSKDGEIVSQISEEFGTFPVRGSSSKGGARAFIELMNSIKKECAEIFITADGPKGPAREIKDGTVILAKKTDATLIPICWSSTRLKILEKTWDKFQIPLPFGRIHFAFGSPIPINELTGDLEVLKSYLKKEMIALETQVTKAAGREILP